MNFSLACCLLLSQIQLLTFALVLPAPLSFVLNQTLSRLDLGDFHLKTATPLKYVFSRKAP